MVGFPFGMLLLMEGGSGNPSAEGGGMNLGICLRIFSAFFHKMIPVATERVTSFFDDFCEISTVISKVFCLKIEIKSNLWYNFHYLTKC